jgi:hypothetical protein
VAPYLAEQVKLAHGLAALDQRRDAMPTRHAMRAFAVDVQPDMDLDALGLDPAGRRRWPRPWVPWPTGRWSSRCGTSPA